MPATFIDRSILTVGFLSLFHSAYSAAQHRSYLRLNDLDFTHLPLDIFLQTIISLFVIMYGVLSIAGDFKEIKASAELENKSWETFRNIPSFYTFTHRGGKCSPILTKTSLEEIE
ncbi:ER membrane protein complex subunit 5 [Diorhabda carinulata]|uniref:ER membrane protein complex subunit 5 n=1 Tax=Diorhabda sublineata TaxID=1163346 RepID=UPI0024E12549|nr:ER membrane protein complex subunit 5 [Diorhabda sublineata]XP_056636771.1 ER membrane protein complex subunit 5 [Diorhabda sublineata]XP_057653413.1 ER membrane protein complex subunit 5 [Diorhabda carinulata]